MGNSSPSDMHRLEAKDEISAREFKPNETTKQLAENKMDISVDLSAKCADNLESCVTGCVPLEDVYAYSLCVVECAQKCSWEQFWWVNGSYKRAFLESTCRRTVYSSLYSGWAKERVGE